MMIEQKEAVIFDLDGTMTDSMWIWEEIDQCESYVFFFLSQFFIYIIIEVCLQICKLFTDNQHKCDAAPTASNMDKD